MIHKTIVVEIDRRGLDGPEVAGMLRRAASEIQALDRPARLLQVDVDLHLDTDAAKMTFRFEVPS